MVQPMRRDTIAREYPNAAEANREAQDLVRDGWRVGTERADKRGRISVIWYRDVPADMTTSQPVAPVPTKKNRRYVLIALLIVVGFIVIASIIGAVSSGSGGAIATANTSTAPLTDADYQTVDVRDLKKNPDAYKGKPLRLNGEVFNIKEQGGRTFLQMWVAIPGGTQFDREAVVVNYSGTLPNVYEKTKIIVFGVGAGTDSGTNAFGAKSTQPSLRADRVTTTG